MEIGVDVPVHNDLAEKDVLGCLIMEPSCYDEIRGIITKPEVFYSKLHQEIFKAISGLNDTGIQVSIITIAEELKKRKKLDYIGGTYYLTALMSSYIDKSRSIEHARLVYQDYMWREIDRNAELLHVHSKEKSLDPFEAVAMAAENIQKITSELTANLDKTPGIVAREAIEKLNALANGKASMKSFIPAIDDLTNGFWDSELVIIAARTSMGKTALALDIAYNNSIYRDNLPVAYFTVEMDEFALFLRLVSKETGISSEKIKANKLSSEELVMIQDFAQKYSQSQLYLSKFSQINARMLLSKAERYVKNFGVRLIVVDYIQLTEGEGGRNESREREISKFTKACKRIAQEYSIPVIALAQLNREIDKRAVKVPQLSDLRESGAIEQDADIVLFLDRPEVYGQQKFIKPSGIKDIETFNKALILCAKNRNGRLGYNLMAFNKESARFTSLDMEHEQKMEFDRKINIHPDYNPNGYFREPEYDDEIPF